MQLIKWSGEQKNAFPSSVHVQLTNFTQKGNVQFVVGIHLLIQNGELAEKKGELPVESHALKLSAERSEQHHFVLSRQGLRESVTHHE